MKACPTCQRLYSSDAGFCPVDGAALKLASEIEVPAARDDKRIGQHICGGRYHVRRRVADGGMGRVYQALDTQEQRSVAIKVLHPEVACDEVGVERFKREWQLSARLSHAHIVEVLDFHETEDESYALVMEYLEGEELRTMLQRDTVVRAERGLRMLAQLAIGLEQPHSLKLVHRDIKPDNIFLCGTEDGVVVKLLDFGSVRDNRAGAAKLTMLGTTIGSPYYMSPEQAQGLPDLDHRADVWSIAAILYEALSGELPFAGNTGPQILLAILSREPQPPSLFTNADAFRGDRLPEAVDDALSDAFTKNPAIRIGSVGALADRVGAAFGLSGSHVDWAYLPERKLRALMRPALDAARGAGKLSTSAGDGPSLDVPQAMTPPAHRETSGDRAPPSRAFHDDAKFHDDDFAMGVPARSSSKLGRNVVLVAGVGLVLIAVAAIVLL
ncbi:MAG: serine/threonine protein kinase [Myxococcales bacterium]|nr:serine/threonine protein kinase [Myxococcales bacterium]